MMILYTLAYIIVIALAVNTMFAIPLYKTYTPNIKPFNCIFCMAFWVCVIIGAITFITPLPLIYWLGVTLATPYLSALLKKIMDNLPTHF